LSEFYQVERKAKFTALIRDADSCKPGVQTSKSKRSFFCRIAVALSMNIRNHFNKHISENQGLIQVTVPTLENTHPSLERFLIPIGTVIPYKPSKRKLEGSSENSLEGLDLLSHTISSHNSTFEGNENKGRDGDLDESDVLGMGGLLSLRAYNPDTAAITFCENIYNRSIPPKEKRAPKAREPRSSRFRGEDDEDPTNPFRVFGFGLTQKEEGGPLLICSVRPGSAAYSFGIRCGDVVTHVDGDLVGGRSLAEVQDMLAAELSPEQKEASDVAEGNASDAFFSERAEQEEFARHMLSIGGHLPLAPPPVIQAAPNAIQDICLNRSPIPPFLRLGWIKRKVYERNRDAAPVVVGDSNSRLIEAEVSVAMILPEGGPAKKPRADSREDILQVEGSSGEEGIEMGYVENLTEPVVRRGPRGRSVSSLGCSRAFITCVLARALEHVKSTRSFAPVSFPFPVADINAWLHRARDDCHNNKVQM
jgi:hypothetical protein